MELRKVSDVDAGPEHPVAGVVDRVARQQPDEVALAGAILADHAHALTEEDLRTERLRQAGEGELRDTQCDGPGATPTQADRDLLLARPLDQLGLFVEEAKPALGRSDFRAPHIGTLRAAPVLLERGDQCRSLLLVAPVIFLEAFDSCPPRLFVARE